MALARERYGETHPYTARCWLAGAHLLMDKGRYAEAERLTRRALDILPAGIGAAGTTRAYALENLGELLCARNDFAGAERSYREAAEIHASVCGEARPCRLDPLLRAAFTRIPQGDLEGAEEIASRVLSRAKESLGERSTLVAMAHSLLGNVTLATGREEAAESHLRRAIALYDDLLGPDSGHQDPPLKGLGHLLSKRALDRANEREYGVAIKLATEAEGLLRKALEGYSRPESLALAGNAARRGEILQDLARVLRRRGRCHQLLEDLEASDRDLRAALPVAREAFGEEHRATLACEILLCLNHVRSERYELAEKLARAALPRARKLLPPATERNYLDVDGFIMCLGLSLLRQKRWEEAEPHLRECLELREQHLPESWCRYNALSLLGECLSGQGRHAEAEPLLLEGWERMEPPASMRSRKDDALARIVKLYEAWGKPGEAARWGARAAPEQGSGEPSRDPERESAGATTGD
jgi:tetratricopeptide (TPR) repeat protein